LNVPVPQLCQWWGPCHKELCRGDRPDWHTEWRPRRSLRLGSHSQHRARLAQSCWTFSHHSEHILRCRLQVLHHSSVLQRWACELNLLPSPCVIQLFCNSQL
jgi:IS5 family transposase